MSFAHITFCVLVSFFFFFFFFRLLLHVYHAQPICTLLSCTVILILKFKSTVYYRAHYCIFCSLYLFLIIIHFILCILLCVVFYNIALSMERTWLTFHCWLILCIIMYVTNKSWTWTWTWSGGLSSYKVVVWTRKGLRSLHCWRGPKKELGSLLSPLDCEHQKDWGHVRLVPFLVHFKWTGFGSLKTNYMWKHPKDVYKADVCNEWC